MAKVSKLEEMVGLPKFGKIEKNVYGPCQLGIQTKSTHPKINVVATSRPLELLHVDQWVQRERKAWVENNTSWSWLMISQGTLGWNSLERSQRHVTRWKGYARGFKMKRDSHSQNQK